MIRQGAPTGPRRRQTRWERERELEQQERDRNYRELMAELAEARETGAEWYLWILNGRPVLTAEQYSRVGRHSGGRNQRADSPRDRGKEEPSTGSRDAQGSLI